MPVLLAMSDNGPQMSSGANRQFMALCWLATHYGRPGTPTGQAWTQSLFGHLKTEQPNRRTIEWRLRRAGRFAMDFVMNRSPPSGLRRPLLSRPDP